MRRETLYGLRMASGGRATHVELGSSGRSEWGGGGVDEE